MAKELAKSYNPSEFEDRIYDFWLKGNYFHAEVDKDKKPYTIVMPPPNVTGQLHMGHALDETLQDILIRWRRMQGYSALWLPGTDHASIATEAKIVEAMRKEGITKEDIGREEFLKRAWEWKKVYGGRITSQLKKLGSSCDWERERFTMDEGCSKAVKEVFVRLYNDGKIYRGNRMVNWCPHCCTSISDAEVEYKEQNGHFWHLLYQVKETGEYLEIATTRPETMLGDTAVAVNKDDERYKHLHGCHVILPLLNKEIPIVCDEHADMEKGTGVVKITPAHDPNDFEVGQRCNLPIVRCFTYDGHLTGAKDVEEYNELKAKGQLAENEPEVLDCGKYAGMTTMEAREAIVADLKEIGALKEVEELTHVKADVFTPGDKIDVTGKSKGKGTAGVIKRWNFHRLKESHGTGPCVRHGGSIGACSSPSRVWKGKRMAGHLGAEQVTVQNLTVVKVDAENNLIAVKGAIPGPNKGIVVIKDSVKA